MPDDMVPEGDDLSGFVIAVEAGFDPNYPSDYAEEPAGFMTGQLRVLGGLVWSDLYTFAQALVAHPEDLWPLAMYLPEYPWEVSVGATVPARVAEVNLEPELY
ncbi:hypothetical protein Vi05172_g2849 [Venturia inaequalis]|uniref:Uncharacterized protein n=1 Tax=Venturia inaequalis TaxID=5025 RepID=A0A8H3VAU1_VENIN|nr:hypothetical protein EG327_004681 [Venturia inaequalis]RDI87142.1 hypothetical protein Vi05172_g2849 [Venturia inaequalis]